MAELTTCAELGRVTRCYVSGYQRARVHSSRLVSGERRCLIANFHGAIPAARSITSVTWRCDQPYTCIMSDAVIADTGREASVTLLANTPSVCAIKCAATLDNGEVYTQVFRVAVAAMPWLDVQYSGSGPRELTATA